MGCGEESGVVMVEAEAIGEGAESSGPQRHPLSLPLWGSQGERKAQQAGQVQPHLTSLSQHHPSRRSLLPSVHEPIW